MARDIGMKFDLRVLGIPNHLNSAKQFLARPDVLLEQNKLRDAESALIEHLPAQKRQIQELFRRKLNAVSHFQCERFNFLQPLQEFACFIDGTTPEEVVEENAWTGSLHILLMGKNDALIVPLDFNMPLNVEVEGRAHPYVVCSGIRMKKELDGLNEYVAVEETLGINDFGPFVSIARDAMSRFEQIEGVGRRFWAKWGVMALRGAVDRSIKSNVPVIVDPQFGEVPVIA